MSPLSVSLGFAEGRFPAGAHVCQVFSDNAERDRALVQFLVAGLREKECCTCFIDQPVDALWRGLRADGIDPTERCACGALTVTGSREAYLPAGRFEPEVMLAKLREFQQDAVARGFSAARVMGEMSERVESAPGGTRLMEYEVRVSMLLRECPITTVCQYDARGFDGGTIMDILRVHPFVLVRGAVVENPFYVTPEQFLEERSAS